MTLLHTQYEVLTIEEVADYLRLPVETIEQQAKKGQLPAAHFDRLRLQSDLRKIGRADILIASIALAQRATLVTRNVRHFRQIPGLRLTNWVD